MCVCLQFNENKRRKMSALTFILFFAAYFHAVHRMCGLRISRCEQCLLEMKRNKMPGKNVVEVDESIFRIMLVIKGSYWI